MSGLSLAPLVQARAHPAPSCLCGELLCQVQAAPPAPCLQSAKLGRREESETREPVCTVVAQSPLPRSPCSQLEQARPAALSLRHSGSLAAPLGAQPRPGWEQMPRETPAGRGRGPRAPHGSRAVWASGQVRFGPGADSG